MFSYRCFHRCFIKKIPTKIVQSQPEQYAYFSFIVTNYSYPYYFYYYSPIFFSPLMSDQ